jgi:hypothetical protein
VGPAVAAVGIALFARAAVGDSYWSSVFPAVCLLGFGMTITVAPLTTTVMGAVDTAHSGVASGINNTVARVAGLLTIAVFGVLLSRKFDAEVKPRLDHLGLPAVVRAQVDKELPRMAGADLKFLPADSRGRAAVKSSIDEAFVSGFRMVVFAAAALALAAAVFGGGVRPASSAPAAKLGRV